MTRAKKVQEILKQKREIVSPIFADIKDRAYYESIDPKAKIIYFSDYNDNEDAG